MAFARASQRSTTAVAPTRAAAGRATPQQAALARLRAGGNRACARAVLARDDNRRATPPPAPTPTPAPPAKGSAPAPAGPTCGPDVTQPVLDALAKTSTLYTGWDSRQRDRACSALDTYVCAGAAWDIVELHNRAWLDGYAPCADKGGACKDTVSVGGQCSYAGSVNYVVFGAMCKLCDISKWWMEDLIWAYKGSHPLGQSASANYGPSLEWARAGYEGWPAVPSPKGDRPGCGNACPTAYAGPAFKIHWYPESAEEHVSQKCKDWASWYPPEYLPGDFGL